MYRLYDGFAGMGMGETSCIGLLLAGIGDGEMAAFLGACWVYYLWIVCTIYWLM